MAYSWTSITHKLWLQPCLLCSSPTVSSVGLCKACRGALPANEGCCNICALPLADKLNHGAKCGSCQQRLPHFDRIRAPFRYERPIADLIIALKFRHRLAAGRVLGSLLTAHIARLDRTLPDCVIPVPLHPQRLRERGFNQAMELARIVSRGLDLPISTELIKRVKQTPSQAGLQRSQRLRNLANAFAQNYETSPEYVAIVDDVVTTGATADTLARTLKRAGAARVDIWAVARTPKY